MTVATVKIDLPNGLDQETATEIAEYIVDALQSWGGQRHPDDHLFSGLKTIRIKIGHLDFKGEQFGS